MLIFKQLSIDKYARSCAARAGMGVIWHEGPPMCDGKNIYLHRMDTTTTQEDIDFQLHCVVHEVGHFLHSDFNVLKNVPQQSYTMFIFNILEDHRINYLNASAYEGDKVGDNKFYSKLKPETLAKLVDNKDEQMMYNIMAWECDIHADYAYGLRDIEYKGLDKGMQEKLAKFTPRLRDVRTIEEMTAGSGATMQLAKDILKELDPEQQAEDQKEEDENAEAAAKEEAEKGEKGEKGKKGEEEGDGEGEGEGDGDPKEGDGEGDSEGKEGKGKPKPSKKYVPSYKEITGEPDLHDRGVVPKSDEPRFDPDGVHYNPTAPDQVEVCRMTDNVGTMESNVRDYRNDRYKSTYGQYKEDCSESLSADGLANKVRAKLQIRSRARTTYAQKKGKIHGAGLHRLMIKDGGGYSERVFKDKIVTDVLDVAVGVVVDTSGSMSGHKYSHAIKATTILNHIVGNVLGVPLGIYGFSTHGSPEKTSIALYRNYNEVTVPTPAIEKAMCSYLENTGRNNADGEAFVYAYHHLMQVKAKRHVLLLLSDGEPESSRRRGDIHTYTKQVCDNLIRDRRVEVLGVGMMSDAIRRYVPNTVVLNKASELEPCLLKLLDKTLM